MRSSIPFLILLLLSACAPKAIPNAIYQDKLNMVRLEAVPQDEPSGPADAFQHPLELTEEEIAIVLQSVWVQDPPSLLSFMTKSKPVPRKAFTEEEAKRMAGPLRAALAQSRPNERVAFLFTQSRGRFLKGVTSGALFAKEGLLHLIVGRYKAAARPHEKSVTLNDPVLPDPPYNDYRLAPGLHQTLIETDRTPLWKEPTGVRHWVRINYRKLLAEPAGLEAPPAESEPAAAGAPSTPERTEPMDIKEKLRLLKDLRDENLISEEEYQKKREEILKEF